VNQDRANIKKDLMEVLKSFIDRTSEEIYGEKYIGKVIDNNDPEKLGRCRIRVYGVYNDSIGDGDIPWAKPEFGFIGSELGSFIVPPVDALVYVRFSNGDIYNPLYSGKAISANKLPSDKDTDYPNTLVFFELDNGDKFTINRNDGKTIYEQRHGIKITMDTDGSFTLEHDKGSIFEVDSDGNVVLKTGDTTNATIDIESSGDINIKGGGTSPVGTVNVESGAAGMIKLQGGTIPCPDAIVCAVTGAPLATGTLAPGSTILIP